MLWGVVHRKKYFIYSIKTPSSLLLTGNQKLRRIKMYTALFCPFEKSIIPQYTCFRDGILIVTVT